MFCYILNNYFIMLTTI